MPHKKKVENTAWLGLFLQIIFAGIAFALYYKTGEVSKALLAETWFLLSGVPVWGMVALHGRQRRRAREEREEMEELKQKRTSEEIFEDQELDRMRAHTGLRIFEKFVETGFSVLLAVLLGFLCYWNIQGVIAVEEMKTIESPLAAVVGMAVISFFGFVLAKYVVGLAHDSRLRLLRAAGSYLMGNVVGSLLILASMSLYHFGIELAELAAAFIVPGVMGLIAVEMLLNFILDIYRPRVPGQERRAVYDSRLLNLVSEPGDILQTVAATLDYQFGFKISETWFYRFMQGAIIPLILIWLSLLWLLSGLVVVDRGEIAFIERFGKPRLRPEDKKRELKASVYGPGYHLKWPWPIEKASRIPAKRIYRKEIGRLYYEQDDVAREQMEPPGSEGEIQTMTDPDIILWKELHVDPKEGKEASFLVPSVMQLEEKLQAPALNIARLVARFHYRIKRQEDGSVDPKAAYNFHYRHANPEALIEDLAYRVTCELAASQNFLEWINVRRGEVSRRFAKKFSEQLNAHKTGVEVVYAGMPAVHPPAQTAEAYEDVISAYQEKKTMVQKARATAYENIMAARGKAAQALNDAKGYRYKLTEVSQAQEERFREQVKAYKKAPQVYRYRSYFSAIEQVLAGHRLFIVPVSEVEVPIIDMQERLSTDILSMPLEEEME
ncbi:MAG: SPFH domain-containing protein [Candidatus Brocadiia bacterium]